MPHERAIVTIYRKLYGKYDQRKCGHYLAVVELVNMGYTRVELVLPRGVEEFPVVPYMVTVACDDVYAELRDDGKEPLIIINEWQPMNHFYM